ncbi:MAG TPA: cyclic pyranopterin monophosphate synthase MoaC [Ohtaekwangia sp.]|nr:cyclic pyranopterin monophosphate synthase MoaC [Ohtaekwangia sp.]
MSKKEFTHVSPDGKPQMVNVGNKKITLRTAKAGAILIPGEAIMSQITGNEIITKKGPVFHTAIIAGVMAAKKTSELIPFCHPLGLEDCQIRIHTENNKIVIEAEVSVTAKTGVEMEALTAASVAALTIYDMCKALSHDIVIKEIKLLEKTGGKKDFKRT